MQILLIMLILTKFIIIGVNKDDIQVDFEDGVVQIKAERFDAYKSDAHLYKVWHDVATFHPQYSHHYLVFLRF